MIESVNKTRILLSSRFNAQLEKAPTEIKIAFTETLEVFEENPLYPHTNLRSHPLKKQYTGYNSIDVTDDWRALFKVKESKHQTIITFHILGIHTQLYG